MGSRSRQKILYGLFVAFQFIFQVTRVDCFPVSKTIEPEKSTDVYSWHSMLAKKVVPQESENLFICCFMFLLSNGKTEIVPLCYNFIDKKVKDRVDENVIDGKGDKAIDKTDGNFLVFRSGSENMTPLKRIFSSLHKQFKNCVKTESPGTKNQAMQLCAQDNWVNSNNACALMRYTDSEARAIYVLQHQYVIDNIINCICAKIDQMEPGVQIDSIEFHGCTTRDMCPLCFTNMNIIQYLCNNPSDDPDDFSFLRYLRDTLTTNVYNAFYSMTPGRIYAKKDCVVKTFISSLSAWAGDGNLNFPEPEFDAVDKLGFVHQFRIR